MTIYYLILDENGNVSGNGISNTDYLPECRVACTQAQAQKPFDWAVVNGEIVPSPNLLANAQVTQLQILSGACAAQIVSGFTSSALGSANIYASDTVDQQNIVQSAQSTKGGLLSCQNADGTWSRVAHTQAQAQQVLEDFVTARDTARLKLQVYETQIMAATTVEAVQAILWESTP